MLQQCQLDILKHVMWNDCMILEGFYEVKVRYFIKKKKKTNKTDDTENSIYSK